jgi:hypothetical protein
VAENTNIILRNLHKGSDEWGNPYVSATVRLPATTEEALQYLARALPEVDWRNLAIYRLRVPDGSEVLALPARTMEQLLMQVVGLCMVIGHDGPAQ